MWWYVIGSCNYQTIFQQRTPTLSDSDHGNYFIKMIELSDVDHFKSKNEKYR